MPPHFLMSQPSPCRLPRMLAVPAAIALSILSFAPLAYTAEPATTTEKPATDWVPLFDGQTLEGWEGNTDWFHVVDGAIVGGDLQRAIPRNEFLCTKREYGDFELELEFKLVGRGVNAGVQLRSQRIPNHHEVKGYQADLGQLFWGCLYDESRRNKVLQRPSDQAALERALKLEDWNHYRILCQGRRIQLWINDCPTVDYTEPDADIPQSGILGLQIHAGPASQAWYREIRIREL